MASFDNLSRNNNNTGKYHVVLKVMARHPELCCLLLVVSVTLLCKYGSSIQTRALIAPPRSPTRFYPPNSLVTDFPFGAMEPATNILAQNEFIFIMYYAPWCSKSRASRIEFQKAARTMQGEVRFVSINCWWKEGECRRRMKFPFYPQFYAYHTNLNGFRYQGIVGAEHMVKFLDSLRFPLTFIFNKQSLKDFISSHQTAVVGYFDFGTSPEPPGFLQFYYASMRVLEHDITSPPRFAVITSRELGSFFEFRSDRRIAMTRLFNTTIKFPLLEKLTSGNILEWVMRNSEAPLVNWVIPPGVKSLLLSSYLDRGPVLIHFTRIDPLFSLHNSLSVMETVALIHREDKNGTDLREALNSTAFKSVLSSNHYLQTKSMCEKLRGEKKQFLYSRVCCVSVLPMKKAGVPNGYRNTCEICQHSDSMNPLNSGCSMNSLHPVFKTVLPVSAKLCTVSIRNYNVNRHTSLCCGMREWVSSREKKNSGRKNTDDFVRIGRERWSRYMCRKLRLHYTQSLPAVLSSDIPSQTNGLIRPVLAMNQSLTFLIMDVRYHVIFAHRFGANALKNISQTSSVTMLIDKQNEWHSIMNTSFSEANLKLFLHNYSKSLLNRFQRSELSPSSCDKNSSACVTDLSAQTFHSVVMDTSKDVCVLFYASWCGFCASISHVYLALARYFKSAKNMIFTRINADKNDLPWEFTMDSYPTLIFFPAHRKADSAVFPDDLPKTLPSLIKFVLRHATPHLRMDTASGICSASCIKKNKREVSYTILEMYRHVRRLKRKIPQISLSVDNARRKLVPTEEQETQKFRIQLLLSQYVFLKQQLSRTEQQVKSARLLEDALIKSKEYISFRDLERFQSQHRLLQRNFVKAIMDNSYKAKHDEL